MGLKIEIDTNAGVCFGVEKALELVDNALDKGEEIYSLGHMLHNSNEINRLDKKGLKTISTEDFPSIKRGKVVLRAHGEPPSTFEKASLHDIQLIDATCPIVQRLQKKIHSLHLKIDRQKEQIVIFGKKNHPETIGLLGQTGNEAILITDPGEFSKVNPEKKTYLFSQTTMDPDQYALLEENLQKRVELEKGEELVSECSICSQMKRRKPLLREFVKDYDLVLFISGRNSSNGNMLYSYAKSFNGNIFLIEHKNEIQSSWLKGAKSIGISGATSTPAWQLTEVKEHLLSITAG